MNFRVWAVQSGETREVGFAELIQRRTIVSIYMRNNTPACDSQVAVLLSQANAFAERGYGLVAISRDTRGSHARYAGKHAIGGGMTLVSDPDDFFANAADAVVDKMLYGRKYRGPARSVFVLAADGTVMAVIEKVNTRAHPEQLRAMLAALPDV